MCDLIQRWRRPEYRKALVSVLVFLVLMLSAFYVSAISGPDLRLLLGAVVACFMILTMALVRHVRVGLLLMPIAGLMGLLTDLWGVSNGIWAYAPTSISLWFIGGEPPPIGIPFEVVVAYLAAPIWFIHIIETLFDVEVDRAKKRDRVHGKRQHGLRDRILLVSTAIAAAAVCWINPGLWQPAVYPALGLAVILALEPEMRRVPLLFAVLIGVNGCYFELYSTGQIIPQLELWTYLNPDHGLVRLGISAFLGYAGTGGVLAGVAIWVLRLPFFATETPVLRGRIDRITP